VPQQLRREFTHLVSAVLVAIGAFGVAQVCRADEVPKPDPAGLATGTAANVIDAAGNLGGTPT